MIACTSLQVMADPSDTIAPKQPPADQDWGCGQGKPIIKNLTDGEVICPIRTGDVLDECDGEGCAGVLSGEPPK
jgi:hypothetical protein